MGSDGSVALGDTDLTGKCAVVAFEANESGSWLKFMLRADAGPVEFDFDINTVDQYLGGAPEGVALTVAEVEAAVVEAMANSRDPEAYGKAIIALLRSKGIEVDS